MRTATLTASLERPIVETRPTRRGLPLAPRRATGNAVIHQSIPQVHAAYCPQTDDSARISTLTASTRSLVRESAALARSGSAFLKETSLFLKSRAAVPSLEGEDEGWVGAVADSGSQPLRVASEKSSPQKTIVNTSFRKSAGPGGTKTTRSIPPFILLMAGLPFASAQVLYRTGPTLHDMNSARNSHVGKNRPPACS